jgi:hypothetical protein
MRQSRLTSLVEAATNVVIGYGVAVPTQIDWSPVCRHTIIGVAPHSASSGTV